MIRLWVVLAVWAALVAFAATGFGAGREEGRRIGYAAGMTAGYSKGFSAPHPIKPVALIEIDNCAGALVHISVDSAGRVFFTAEREFTEEEADFIVKLSRATGGTAHIVVTDGCL